jgi:hypothetical protein
MKASLPNWGSRCSNWIPNSKSTKLVNKIWALSIKPKAIWNSLTTISEMLKTQYPRFKMAFRKLWLFLTQYPKAWPFSWHVPQILCLILQDWKTRKHWCSSPTKFRIQPISFQSSSPKLYLLSISLHLN